MLKFNSLTAKYVLLSILPLAFISGYVTADFIFTQNMKGVARKINLAGSERMLIVRISSHAHALAGSMTFADKKIHGKDILKAMAEYEDVLQGLRDGSEKLGVEPIRGQDKESTSQLVALIELWENAQKPVLFGIVKDNLVKGKETCKACHAAIRDKAGMIDDFVASLERYHENEIKQFDLFRFYVLGLFLVMAVFVFLFTKKKLILPVRKLHDAVVAIEQGNYGVTVKSESNDEIGRLSTSFNDMSRNLKSGFDENTRLVKELSSKKDDLDILNKISSALSSSLSVEDIVNRALDEVLNLEHLRIDKKGAFFLADEKTRTLHLAAYRGFTEEFARLEATVPFGDCLCGLAAESGDCILSEDCFTDKRHTRRYPEMTGHGHINIPLKSRDKMLGVFCLYLPAQTKLSDEEKSFFQSIARIVSVSLENALNHKQVSMLAKALDSSNDVITITDIHGRIIHVNPETTRQTGYSVDELVGRPVSIIQSPHNPSGLGVEISKKTLEGGWFGEVINRRKDGSEYPVLLTTSPVKDERGQVISLVGVARDITERKRAEAVLLKYSEDLENKVKERTLELEIRRMEAEGAKMIAMSADQAKSEFLANMSHELRTPLNAVLGFSEMMVKGMTGALSPKQVEYLKHINESGAFLLSLINDILDLSKVEAGKMDLEYKEIDVRYVVDRVLLLFKEKTMKHGIQLAVDIEEGTGVVLADERRIKQVLLNLLSNAVKFTPDGGAVRVSARRLGSSELRVRSEEINSKLDGDFVEISVANKGPGIKAEDIPKLFKPFQQLDSSYEKKHQGTGLGLALCKRIVELHNGKIWVESEVDKETVFIFVIPITRREGSGPNVMPRVR